MGLVGSKPGKPLITRLPKDEILLVKEGVLYARRRRRRRFSTDVAPLKEKGLFFNPNH